MTSSKKNSIFWVLVLPALVCTVVVGCEKEEKRGIAKEVVEDEWDGVKPQKPRPEEVLPSTAAFSRDGKLLLVGFKPSFPGNPRHRVLKLFDVETGKEIRTLRGHKEGVFFVTFLPNSKQALSTGGDSYCKIWDLQQGVVVREFKGENEFSQPTLTSDGGKALIVTGNLLLELWDLKAGKLLKSYPGYKNVRSITVSPDGKSAIWGRMNESSDTLEIWSIAKEKVELSFGNRTRGFAVPAAFSPNEKWVVSNKWTLLGGAEKGLENSLVLWDVKTGKEIRGLENSTAAGVLTFTRDGKSVVSIEYVDSSGVLKRYDVKTGKQLINVSLGNGIAGQGVVAFSPDAKLVFLGRHPHPAVRNIEDLNLEIWDTARGEKLRKLAPNKIPYSGKLERD